MILLITDYAVIDLDAPVLPAYEAFVVGPVGRLSGRTGH
jgi:hypothetical protein